VVREGGPRIPPGSRREIGLVPTVIAAVAGRVTGSGPPNLFTTLARHRRLFLSWLWFAGRLMPRGRLPRRDTELVILRVAHNCHCEYEWRHHERIAQTVHASRDVTDQLWDSLRRYWSDVELIELCMLVGHYEMLAMTLNALRVVPDR
jgi:alkylhydroperoxidase family enzyme